MNITKLSVNRPTLIVVVFTIIILLGLFSYRSLNYELMPSMSVPIIVVSTQYPGASPIEVENGVTKKIEDALSTLENLDGIQSVSMEGFSMLKVLMKRSANIDYVLQDAQRKINTVKGSLPASIREPMISKVSFDDLPIMNIGATSKMAAAEFYDLLKHRIQPALTQIKGVGEIILIGGSEREIRVSLDAAKLEAYNISALQVTQAVQSSNQTFPTGKIKNGDTQMVIRLEAKFKNLHDIKNVIVASHKAGSTVKLKDIATISDTEKEITTLVRVNGVRSVGLSIKKQSGANTVGVSHLVKKELITLEQAYKDINLKFTIPTDTSDFIEKAASAVKSDLVLVVFLVSLVMLLFLHSLRNAFIVMLAVPISLIGSYLGMYILGYSLNIMTLLAQSLVIGILVDDAIVVVENIHRHLEMGKNRVQATIDGRNQIGFTAFAITLVDVVVFLPLGLSQSIISPILRPYAIVIVISSLLSLLVAFTVVPLLTSRLAKLQPSNTNSISGYINNSIEKSVEFFTEIIQQILVWSMRHKAITFLIVLMLLMGSIALIPTGFIGSEVTSMGDANQFIIQVELPKNVTLKETNLKILEIEHILFSKPEVKDVFTTIGSTSSGMIGSEGGAYKAEISVKLVDKEYRTLSSQNYGNQVKNELLSKIIGAKIRMALIDSFSGGTDDSPIQIVVQSNNPESLNRLTQKIQNIVKKTPGTLDVSSTLEAASSDVSVVINKERMADLGLSLSIVGPVMQIAFNGDTDAKFKDGSYEYDINIIYDQFNRQRIADVANLSFVNASGHPIRLSQFADISFGSASVKLERYNRISSITILAQVLGRASGEVGDEIRQSISSLSLPSDVTIIYEGEMKMQADAFGSLGFALIASVVLVYLVMVALYESYLYPFVVLFSIPLAIIGALLALALTKSTLGIFSLLGMVMLIGLVGKNAIIVVDFTNQLKQSGTRTIRALLIATRVRMRPILMTTMALVIGLLPIALASGPASEWKNGLAWVLIGGLLSSMLLTMIVVPLIYLVTDTIKESLTNRLFTRKQSVIDMTKRNLPSSQ